MKDKVFYCRVERSHQCSRQWKENISCHFISIADSNRSADSNNLIMAAFSLHICWCAARRAAYCYSSSVITLYEPCWIFVLSVPGQDSFSSPPGWRVWLHTCGGGRQYIDSPSQLWGRTAWNNGKSRAKLDLTSLTTPGLQIHMVNHTRTANPCDWLPCHAPIGRLSPLPCLFTSPSCWGTHFLYLSNPTSPNLGTSFPLFHG